MLANLAAIAKWDRIRLSERPNGHNSRSDARAFAVGSSTSPSSPSANKACNSTPSWKTISAFLDDHDELIEQVRQDLQRGLKKPNTGRNGLTPSQVLRSFLLRRIKNWEYRELRERIADGYTLRQFTDFYSQPVPKHDAFHRAFRRLTPQTLETINELVIRAAVEMGLEDGSKLRVDTTCDVATLCYTSLCL